MLNNWLVIIVCEWADLTLELTKRSGKLSFRIKGGNKVLRATFQRGLTVNINYNQYSVPL